MTTHRTYLFFFFAPLLTAVMLLLVSGTGHDSSEMYHSLQKDTLVYAMGNNRGDYYIHQAEPTGYQLEMIRAFTQSHHCKYVIRIEPEPEERRRQLAENKIDIMVCGRHEFNLHAHDEQTAAFMLPDSSAWVVNSHRTEVVCLLNQWMAQFRYTQAFRHHQQKYFKSQLTIAARTPYSSLSPYDGLIKKYALTIDWDWRLLAALVCQESRFNPHIESRRGACGLMQVMPQTAESFGITNLEDPENNMLAGTKLLAYLKKYLQLDNVEEINRLKFILAAYNAGMSRINDCRAFAETQGKDPNNWDEVAAVIPLMKHEIYYSGDAIQLGRFKGMETLKFVKEIWERYENYKNLVTE
jgi:membrane-bound lytic murein transglycosylase F